MNRIYTRKPLIKRIMESDWILGVAIVVVLLVLPAIAEAACTLIGAGYDPRIGTPS